MEPIDPTTEEPAPTPESTAPEPTASEPSGNRSMIFGILGLLLVAVLAFLLVQANGDKSDLQDRLDARTDDVTRLTGDLDRANSQLSDANAELDTAEGVQAAIVDFIAVSLTIGGGISDVNGRCVAETMDAEMGTELLLRSSLAAAGLTPNSQNVGTQFTSGLAEAAATCGVPLNSGNAAPAVSGTALPAFAPTGNDRAVGAAAPTVTGVDFEGATVQIGGTGRPTAIVFLAHWCPHCQREVPQVQGWLDATGGVSGVDE